jgi:hypothetical protein
MAVSRQSKANAREKAEAERSAVIHRIKVAQEDLVNFQKALEKDEGRVVRYQVVIGVELVKLQRLSKRTWTKDVVALGFNPRTARRLQRLGDNWGGQNGLNQSVLESLPNDVMKLEWLCQLPLEKLPAFLHANDCKSLPRAAVIAAVKSVLGLAEAPLDPAAALDRNLRRLKNQIESAIEQLDEAPASNVQDPIRDELSDACQRLQQAVKPDPATSAQPAA